MASNRRLSVRQLSNYIKGVFDDEIILHNLTVYGEVEEIKTLNSSTYFTLIDDNIRLSCVMFSPVYDIKAGSKVEVLGGVKFYEKSGKISFIAKSIDLVGQGKAHMELLKLKQKLQSEGIFDNARDYKTLINSVAVITSETGAVIHDFVNTLRESNIALNIKVLPVKVQGDDAEKTICDAFKIIDKFKLGDICVIMRGGGSAGDLSVFNSEMVARAVHACSKHIISAVGHEVDFTLCDFAADSRASTPTLAAKQIAEHCKNVRNRVILAAESLKENMLAIYSSKLSQMTRTENKLNSQIMTKIDSSSTALHYVNKLLSLAVDKLQTRKQADLTRIMSSGEKALEQKYNSLYESVAVASYKLDALSPLKVIAKGYAKTEKNGKKVESINQIEKGDEIELFYVDGKASVNVSKTDKYIKD